MKSQFDPIRRRFGLAWLILGPVLLLILLLSAPFRGTNKLINVSYDATRELFREVEQAYAAQKPETAVSTIHARSVCQAR